MEVIEGIITVIEVIQVLVQLAEAVEYGINLIEKEVDEFGNVFTKLVRAFDSDGDGINDSEEVIFTLQQTIPKLGEYCLVNNGNEIGLGEPALKLVDAADLLPVLSGSDYITSDGDGFLIDFDNDGAIDDIFYPSPIDFTGDGLDDFFQIVDADDNGLPDLAPGRPFYPVGSDEYNTIIYELGYEEYTIMTKPLAKYTVTEGLLLIGFIFASFAFLKKIFRRRTVV